MKLTLMLLMGSAFIFVGFLALYAKGGTLRPVRVDGRGAQNGVFSHEFQRWFFLVFYLGFGVLAGIFPFHTWSPDGHASAPTATSMLHAGVLMKLGGFGLLRVALPLLPRRAARLAVADRHRRHHQHRLRRLLRHGPEDLKYVIAYSSVSHLGMVMLGISAGAVTAMNGAVFQMFAHGIMTALFFALVGLVYAKAHTRDIDAMGGLARVAPGLAVAFTIGGLSSFGLPGTGGFIAEFLVYMGTFIVKPWVAAIACLGIVDHLHLCAAPAEARLLRAVESAAGAYGGRHAPPSGWRWR